jgi:hypothetical protein
MREGDRRRPAKMRIPEFFVGLFPSNKTGVRMIRSVIAHSMLKNSRKDYDEENQRSKSMIVPAQLFDLIKQSRYLFMVPPSR